VACARRRLRDRHHFARIHPGCASGASACRGERLAASFISSLRETLTLATSCGSPARCCAATPCRRRIPPSPAIVLFTVGIEARPKGVVITHDTMLA